MGFDGPNSDLAKRTCVVTVTYGDRSHLLERVVAAAIEAGVGRVTVVDNGSLLSSQARIDGLASRLGPRIEVVRLPENLGSAVGFKTGLERAAAWPGCEFIWMLDDDTVPKPDALDKLCWAYRLLGGDPRNTLLSIRKSRVNQVRAVTEGARIEIVPNAFLGFHVRELPAKIWRRLRKGAESPSALRFPLVCVDFAPFSGFLFHRSWLERVGLPDERLYLYGDDHEFSARFVREGGRIVLCAPSEIEDIDTSWAHRPVASRPWVSPEADERRLYYTLRNRVWLEQGYVTSSLLYRANRWLYVSRLILMGLLMDRRPLRLLARIRLMRRAWRDAMAGRLGRDPNEGAAG